LILCLLKIIPQAFSKHCKRGQIYIKNEGRVDKIECLTLRKAHDNLDRYLFAKLRNYDLALFRAVSILNSEYYLCFLVVVLD